MSNILWKLYGFVCLGLMIWTNDDAFLTPVFVCFGVSEIIRVVENDKR